MIILLVVSTDSQETFERLQNLTFAATSKSHEVVIFFNSISTGLIEAGSSGEKLRELINSGLSLLACRTSAKEMDLDFEGALMEGVKMSSLGELVGLMGKVDRTLFIG